MAPSRPIRTELRARLPSRFIFVLASVCWRFSERVALRGVSRSISFFSQRARATASAMPPLFCRECQQRSEHVTDVISKAGSAGGDQIIDTFKINNTHDP